MDKLKFHFPNLLKKLKRGPAIMQPKDIGLIIGYTGIGKESVCVDAGTGSGFLTIALANICKKLYSYEKKMEFFQLAQENIKRTGLENVELKNKDVFEGIDESEIDLVVLDLPNAERAIKFAYSSLKKEGWLIGYLPNIEQAKIFHLSCHEAMFSEIFTIEGIVREYEVREYGVRPMHIGLIHTAYLTFARK